MKLDIAKHITQYANGFSEAELLQVGKKEGKCK